jgi:hypothetical protein
LKEPSISPKEYNEFLGGVQPREVRLVRAGVDAPVRYGDVELQAAVELGDSRYEPSDDGFFAWQTGRFTGRDPDGNEMIVVEAEFELRYSSETPISDTIFEVFQNINLPVNVWPYLREFFQQSTLRAGWPGFVLPAFQSGMPLRPAPGADPSPKKRVSAG